MFKSFAPLRLSLMVLMMLALCIGSAMAALPTEVAPAFTALSTLITDLTAAAWPVIISVLLAFGTISLVKRFWKKSI